MSRRLCRLKQRRGAAAALAAALGFAAVHGNSTADSIDDIGKTLIRFAAEADRLGHGLQKPRELTRSRRDLANRRLVDARVAFGLGNYDDAAVMLYEYVAKHADSPSYDEAVYYLAESLFFKQDYFAARSYFTKLVSELGPSSNFYQQALERLIELSLKVRDGTDVQDWLQALDRVPEGKQRSSVPYVRGKHSYFSEQFEEAIEFFSKVTPKSPYYLQAQYFIGASYVAQGDLLRAIQANTQLLRLRANSKSDQHVQELAHLALGRLYYECDVASQCGVTLTEAEKERARSGATLAGSGDQLLEMEKKKLWSKSIDHYLMVPRQSELFDEALYEVAWVYVKNREYDKALRALELLQLADPSSTKMPDMRILEGNLRIRRAQRLAEENEGNSVEEYDRARRAFDSTRAAFQEPHAELVRIGREIESLQVDARSFLGQITERKSDAVAVHATMPDVAADWVAREPEVSRVLAIEANLEQIRNEIEHSERAVHRLEHALAASSRIHVFPALAEKRLRSAELDEAVTQMQLVLAARLHALATPYASAGQRQELARLMEARGEAQSRLLRIPNAELAPRTRIQRARGDYVAIDKAASEVTVILEATDATLVALAKYVDDRQAKGHQPAEIAAYRKAMDAMRAEMSDLHNELALIRRETRLAEDAAGADDEPTTRAEELRGRVRQILDQELILLQGAATRARGADRTKADQITSLTELANKILRKLDDVNGSIDSVVSVALEEVEGSLAEEKARLAAYKREFTEYAAESFEVGGRVLVGSLHDVANRFYDILVHSEIGIIDIAWSQREQARLMTDRLTLDRRREMRTLQGEFRAVLQDEEKKPQTQPALELSGASQ